MKLNQILPELPKLNKILFTFQHLPLFDSALTLALPHSWVHSSEADLRGQYTNARRTFRDWTGCLAAHVLHISVKREKEDVFHFSKQFLVFLRHCQSCG